MVYFNFGDLFHFCMSRSHVLALQILFTMNFVSLWKIQYATEVNGLIGSMETIFIYYSYSERHWHKWFDRKYGNIIWRKGKGETFISWVGKNMQKQNCRQKKICQQKFSELQKLPNFLFFQQKKKSIFLLTTIFFFK